MKVPWLYLTIPCGEQFDQSDYTEESQGSVRYVMNVSSNILPEALVLFDLLKFQCVGLTSIK